MSPRGIPPGQAASAPTATVPVDLDSHRHRLAAGLWAWGLLLLATTAVVLTCSSQAQAAVYWGSDRDGVGAANLDGTGPQWDYFYSLEWPAQGPACGVAVNPEYLYWAASGAIVRRKFDGENLYPRTLLTRPQGFCGFAIDQQHLYWLDQGPQPAGADSVVRANLDGAGATPWIGGLEAPCALAVGSEYIYWIAWRSIGRATLDGTEVERRFIELPFWGEGCSLAVGTDHLYWEAGGSIARANLDGTEVEQEFIPSVGELNGIAAGEGHVYWSGKPIGMAAIGRATLDGSQVEPTWIAGSTSSNFRGVAVDARPTPPELTLPSRPIRFKRVIEYNLRSGAARLGVFVPPGTPSVYPPLPLGGRLSVTSPGMSWKVFPSDVAIPAEGGYSLWMLHIRSGAGKVGKRIRSQLRRRGWAAVNLRLEYNRERAYPASVSRRVILRRYPAAKAGWVTHPQRSNHGPGSR
jgi:hypothetical protein